MEQAMCWSWNSTWKTERSSFSKGLQMVTFLSANSISILRWKNFGWLQTYIVQEIVSPFASLQCKNKVENLLKIHLFHFGLPHSIKLYKRLYSQCVFKKRINGNTYELILITNKLVVVIQSQITCQSSVQTCSKTMSGPIFYGIPAKDFKLLSEEQRMEAREKFERELRQKQNPPERKWSWNNFYFHCLWHHEAT